MLDDDDSNLFELEENEAEFLEICSKLKNHPFPSPWNIFFKTSSGSKFTTEVSELTLEDNSLKENVAKLPVDKPSSVTEKNPSINIPTDKEKITRLRESLMSAKDDSTVVDIIDFDIFFNTASSEIPELFKILDCLNMSDVSLSLLFNAFLQFKDQISIATATGLAHHVISPLVFDTTKDFSRTLQTTILKLAEAYSKAIIDEVLIPYSRKDTSDLQTGIISEIVETSLPNEYISYAIRKIVEHALPVENLFVALKYLIERKVYLENGLYDLLLNKLLGWMSECSKNIKFTKLLTSILSAYGNELNEQQLSVCDEVVKSNKTMIKKAAENLLEKIKAEKLVQ